MVLYDRKKLLLLSIAACFIAASYAILRPFKISLFYQLVGKEYFPLTKILIIVFVIPAAALYAKLIDRYKPHIVLTILFLLCSLFCLLFAVILLHPVWGISNTQPHPTRILGWFFTALLDLYPTFIIGSFWAFVNSISTPEFAKRGYGIIVGFTKIGSIIAAGICWLTLHQATTPGTISFLIASAACLTACSLIFIIKLTTSIPPSYLTGYLGKIDSPLPYKKKIPSFFEGLKILFTTPYVFGIFIIYFCYEIIFTIVEYQATIQLAQEVNSNVLSISSVLFLSTIISQGIGLFVAFIGTTRLLTHISVKAALMIMPSFTIFFVVALFIMPTLHMLLIVMTLLPALNFGIHSPIREMLYIPTIKDIQFKSKAWIDSFGRTFSKSSGSVINMLTYASTSSFFSIFGIAFSLGIALLWITTSFLMGATYKKTIDNKEVIGS